MVINDAGGWRGSSRRSQQAGGNQFQQRDVEGGVNPPHMSRELELDNRRVNDSLDHKRPNVSRCELLGGSQQREIFGEEPHFLTWLVCGCWSLVTVGDSAIAVS